MKTIALLVSLCFTTLASAAEAPASDYGTRAATSAPGREITLKPGTKNVNVFDGETVHFNVDGKRIDWNFNSRTREAVLDLNTLAPDQIPAGAVRVWVLANPIYQG